MKTLKADEQKRVRIPDAKPRQVFTYDNRGNGTFVLTLVRAQPKEAFPRGSLAKYFTAAKNRAELALLDGCTLDRE